MQEAYGVIMAGGAGNRFWPFSRRALPKQFLPMIGCENLDKFSMLAMTARRCEKTIDRQNLLVVTHQDYAPIVEKELPWLPKNNLVFEPCNRDTAPCIALALAKLMLKNPQAVAVFLPSDHYIPEERAFNKDLTLAIELAAEQKRVVMLGVRPTYPATAYGYIACGKQLHWGQRLYYEGEGFLEKPDYAKAQQLCAGHNKLWNSGMVVSRADVLWQKIKTHLPSVTALLEAYCQGQAKLEEIYRDMPKISIDYGVLEKMPPEQMAVLPVQFSWDDVGSFQALAGYWQQREQGNAVAAGTNLMALDSAGCLVSREGGLVALLGVDNLLVAESDGVLLVADKKQDQRVKELVEAIAKKGWQEYL